MRWICAICTEVFDLRKPICFAPCGHIFHRGCLETWLLESSTCPECRDSIEVSSLKNMFPNAETNNESEFSALFEKFKKIELLCNEIKEDAAKFEAEAAMYKQKYLESEHKLHLQCLQMKTMKPQETGIKKLKTEISQSKTEKEQPNLKQGYKFMDKWKKIKVEIVTLRKEFELKNQECDNRKSNNELKRKICTFVIDDDNNDEPSTSASGN